MGIQHHEIPSHWNYFFCLEDDINLLSRWIEFKPKNESVYSIELARLLMTAAAEVDVVAKMLCKTINSKAKADSIHKYQEILITEYGDLPDSVVEIPRHGHTLKPWDEWRNPKSAPYWWQGNNKVKHHRSEHFEQANLKNVLNATAGLCVLLTLYYAREMPSQYPGPTLFEPSTLAFRDGSGIVFRSNR